MALSLNNLPWYGQIGAFVLVSGVAVWGFHSYYASGVEAGLEAKRGRLAAVRADVDRGIAAERRLPEFRVEIAGLERKLDELRPILPEQKDAQDILRRVHNLAVQSNLAIRAFTPRTSTKRQMHEEWPIEFQIEGTYHDLGFFFDRIARFPRIINVGDLEIRARASQTSASTITARCTATTFVLVETPAPPAPGAPAPGAPR